jgi:small subunit ribosomal protein S1
LKKGDEAEFKVIEFNKEFKRVVASHTAIFREEEEKNVKAVQKQLLRTTMRQLQRWAITTTFLLV